jgi:hypothetical protein
MPKSKSTDTVLVSVRVPLYVSAKVNKVAELTGSTVSDVMLLLLQKGCKQPRVKP